MSRESILAGWLVDGSGGHVRQNVLISLHNGIIDNIEAASPEKSRLPGVRDFSHCTLLPGLIDAHLHLFMSATEDLDVRKKQLTLAYDDVKGGIEKRLGKLIAAGIVACRDGGGTYTNGKTESARRPATRPFQTGNRPAPGPDRSHCRALDGTDGRNPGTPVWHHT